MEGETVAIWLTERHVTNFSISPLLLPAQWTLDEQSWCLPWNECDLVSNLEKETCVQNNVVQGSTVCLEQFTSEGSTIYLTETFIPKILVKCSADAVRFCKKIEQSLLRTPSRRSGESMLYVNAVNINFSTMQQEQGELNNAYKANTYSVAQIFRETHYIIMYLVFEFVEINSRVVENTAKQIIQFAMEKYKEQSDVIAEKSFFGTGSFSKHGVVVIDDKHLYESLRESTSNGLRISDEAISEHSTTQWRWNSTDYTRKCIDQTNKSSRNDDDNINSNSDDNNHFSDGNFSFSETWQAAINALNVE